MSIRSGRWWRIGGVWIYEDRRARSFVLVYRAFSSGGVWGLGGCTLRRLDLGCFWDAVVLLALGWSGMRLASLHARGGMSKRGWRHGGLSYRGILQSSSRA